MSTFLAVGSCIPADPSWARDKISAATLPEVQEALNAMQVEFAPGEIMGRCRELLAAYGRQIEEFIVESKKLDSSDKKILRFDNLLTNTVDQVLPLYVISFVHGGKERQKEGEDCVEEFGEKISETYRRKDVYLALGRTKPKNPFLERLWYMNRRSFMESGIDFPPEKQEELRKLTKELESLERAFSKRLQDDSGFVEFTREELRGLPRDVIARFEKTASGKFKVLLRMADISAVLELASHEETRKRIWIAQQNRPSGEAATENVEALERAVLIRQRIAKILGYKNWVDYQVKSNTIGTAADVKVYFDALNRQVEPGLDLALQALSKTKKLMGGEGRLKPWDFKYYENQFLKRAFQVDSEEVASYFPTEVTTQRLLNMFAWFFDLEIQEIPFENKWSPDVRTFAFIDKRTRKALGVVHLDLYQRQGKYNHAAAFQIQFGKRKGQENKIPVNAIVSNFAPAAPGKKAVLSFDELVTLAHELGHVFHFILSGRTPSPSLSGFATPMDFVEALSQFFEYFVRDARVLNLLSGHVDDVEKKLPEELAERLLEHQKLFEPMDAAKTIFNTMLDFELHTGRGEQDSTEIARSAFKEYMGGLRLHTEARPQASFGHLMGGYDGQYSAYFISRMYSAELFHPVMEAGVLTEKAKRIMGRIRRKVYEPGYMDHPIKLCESVLGRYPNEEKFFSEFSR